MNFCKTLFILVMILNVTKSFGQEIAGHLWENRVLLVLTTKTNLATYKNQVKELQSDIEGLNDRKLVIYHSTPTKYKVNGNNWKNSNELYKRFKKTTSPFEIILIGLDGGNKLHKTELVKISELFSIIDAMPMRSNEMKRKNSEKY